MLQSWTRVMSTGRRTEMTSTSLGLGSEVVDRETYDRAVDWFRRAGILLPTFAQLARPDTIPAAVAAALAGVGPDDADPRNLFRVHWYNDRGRTRRAGAPVRRDVPREPARAEARIRVG